MSYNMTNIIAGGDLPSNALNPLDASFPWSSQALAGVQPFGLYDGSTDGYRWPDLAENTKWVPTNIGSPTAASAAMVAPTSTVGQTLQVASGTASATGCQIQSSDGSVSTALAKFFARAGNLIHYFTLFKLNNVNAGFLMGLTEVNVAVLSTAGAILATDGIFLHKAPGASADINLIVRRGGSTTSTTQIVAAANLDTAFHSIGWRFDTTFGEVWFDGIRTGIDLSGGTYQPNAALVFTNAVVTNAAVSRILTLQGTCGFQEAR
jgi:hypothetical protein